MSCNERTHAVSPSDNCLQFNNITPAAPKGLGGLVRDHFSNGRLFATVAWHGGLVDISYWGNQHLGAPGFFQTGLESAWLKLFRACVGFGKKRYYLPWENSKLYPFGISGQSSAIGVDFKQELLLLPDALVQRFGVLNNPDQLPVFIEMFHQEQICRVNRENRTWTDFKFTPELNAMISTCLDENLSVEKNEEESLAQVGLDLAAKNDAKSIMWIGIGCDAPMNPRLSFNGFKFYLTSEPTKSKSVSFFLVFANSEEQLQRRLKELSQNVNKECDELVAGYEGRLLSHPRIDVGNPVLNSAFGQYPEAIHFMKVPDRPGAVRATQAGYFVWGWDGMTPLIACPLANDSEFAANIFRFFQNTLHPKIGIPMAFTSTFEACMKEPFPAQAQYIASLYHYLSITGDLELVREVFPTCKFILDRCREGIVQDTGLVSGSALWPDFPEAMGENGRDISSLNNSLLYQGLRSVEYMANAIGDNALSEECRDWAQFLKTSFIKYLYDEEKGYFITSCSSEDFSPRKHYGCQTVFWITPFARELVSHAPGRIANFMHEQLRSARCLLSLPQWDTAWMEDGNQLGSSYPTADYFYLNMQKLIGDERGVKTWLGDVEWFWRYHTAPEAFTPEAENEDEFGPDNHGGKQLQAVTAWYSSVYTAIAGMDFDHEGLTITPCGDIPVDIKGLQLRGISVDLKISGCGKHIASISLNGKQMPSGTRKISWSKFKGDTASLEVIRSERAPVHPVIVRADGLRVSIVSTKPGHLAANIEGEMTGEIVIQTGADAQVTVNGTPQINSRELFTGTITIPYRNNGRISLEISE